MNIQKYYFLFLTIIYCSISPCKSENPATEIRAVWLTTNWNLDWPSSNLSADTQKKELIRILDNLQRSNINTVLFQVRIRGDVFYKSNIEPYSPFFSLKHGGQNYDPLAFAIQECHKRGLELHAWFVTYPIGSNKQIGIQGSSSVAKKFPQLSKLHQGEWYLDPGNPQTRQYLLSLLDEIVSNYDIDGINFDYIRYPENAKRFPDTDTFKKYGRGLNIESWRRNNITQLVSDAYHLIKRRKPWVQVSCSPLGKYRSLNPMKGTWSAYESVHQDAVRWMQDGIIDAIYPMLYYNEVDFNLYVKDWEQNNNGRFVVPGLGVYRLMNNEGNWNLNDILSQINFLRENKSSGIAFYRAGNILNNIKDVREALNASYFKYPAKLPALTWLKNTRPYTPENIQVYKEGIYTAIEWQNSTTEQLTYTVYESQDENINIDNPQNIVMARIQGNKILIKTSDEERGTYFTVTASDRFHNESDSAPSTYYILSSILEK